MEWNKTQRFMQRRSCRIISIRWRETRRKDSSQWKDGQIRMASFRARHMCKGIFSLISLENGAILETIPVRLCTMQMAPVFFFSMKSSPWKIRPIIITFPNTQMEWYDRANRIINSSFLFQLFHVFRCLSSSWMNVGQSAGNSITSFDSSHVPSALPMSNNQIWSKSFIQR